MKHISDSMKGFQQKLKRLSEKYNLNSAENFEPVEQVECNYCQDRGSFVAFDRSKNDVYKPGETPTRLMSCPHCKAGKLHQKRMWQSHLRRSELPPDYHQATFDNWGDPAEDLYAGKRLAFAAAFDFARHQSVSTHRVINIMSHIQSPLPGVLSKKLNEPDDIRPALMLWGAYGLGKTYLAACAANDMGLYLPVMYCRFTSLLDSLRDTWRSNERTQDVMSKYVRVPVLMLDDVGTPTDRELPNHAKEFASTLFRNRLMAQRPTLMTSNLDSDSFYHYFGAMAAEPVMQYAHWIKMAGGKLRNTRSTFGDIEL